MAGGALTVGVASVKMAIGFQEAMTTLSTGAGVAEKDLRVIGDGIKKISVQTGTTTDQLIKGEFMIASAGFTGASSLKILRAAAEGAKTGNADLATVTAAVTTAMKDSGARPPVPPKRHTPPTPTRSPRPPGPGGGGSGCGQGRTAGPAPCRAARPPARGGARCGAEHGRGRGRRPWWWRPG